MIKRRAEFMYNYFDYDNDRERIRSRFLEEHNKKTTLKEIGDILDKFLLDEKAEGLRYLDLVEGRNGDPIPPAATKDSSNF